MASLIKKRGHYSIQWQAGDGRKTITLTGATRKAGELVRGHLEQMISSAAHATPLAEATAAWLREVGDEFHGKLVAAGLTKTRANRAIARIGPMIDRYISSRTDLKPFSLANLQQVRVTLCSFFGEDRDATTLNKGDAADWARNLKSAKEAGGKGLAPATIATHIKKARQIFRDAVDRCMVLANPFAGLKLPGQANSARNRYVPASDVQCVIECCPDAEWRLIFALARFAGLRIPSELRHLKWTDIDFAAGKMLVRSPKTEHHEGKGTRTVPIFTALLPFLEDAHKVALDGAVYVIARYRGVNLRKRAVDIIRDKAKLAPWPRVFQNLRASCETDLATQFPLHVACQWIGNSQLVAARHYLQTTDDHFAQAVGRAAKTITPGEKTSPDVNGFAAPKSHTGPENDVEANEAHPDRVRAFAENVRENLNWQSLRLQKRLHQYEAHVEFMQAHDLRMIRLVIATANGTVFSHPGPGIPYIPASTIPARAVEGGA